MTDRDLALAATRAAEQERAVKAHLDASRERDDLPEADAALVAYRMVIPFRRALNDWIQTRAVRAALRQPVTQEIGAHNGG